MRRVILAVAIVATTLPSMAHARNAAGSNGARNQGAAHHASTVARKSGASRVFVSGGAPVFLMPSVPVRKFAPLVPYEGDSPEITAALASKSTEANYRGELCRVLPTHAEQRACLRNVTH